MGHRQYFKSKPKMPVCPNCGGERQPRKDGVPFCGPCQRQGWGELAIDKRNRIDAAKGHLVWPTNLVRDT